MFKIVSLTLLFVFLFTGCSPTTATATVAPLGADTSAVQLVDDYYHKINEAQTETELLDAYNLFTTMAMCQPQIAANCDTSLFQKRWWKSKVAYKLYDCGPATVVAEETRYPRSDSAPSASAVSKFWQFDLMQSEDGFLIDDLSVVQSPGDGCTLVLESSAHP
jgi:hypothetical protein